MNYRLTETITAIATPPGEGGVAIIRISGKSAINIADKIFSGNVYKYQSHKAYYGNVIDENEKIIDDVLLIVMKGEKSYPGEDTVEIHCHGGSLISKSILELIIRRGARLAQPGEFTFRAFVNGKIDLTQAEAVQELIGAKSNRSLTLAQNQLQGRLSQKIRFFQQELIDIAAILEAWVDFPEEDLEFESKENIAIKLRKICDEMQILEKSFYQGKITHNGVSVCIAGSPNVGKSSLMNALLNFDRSIVTEIPGTTRDILEDDLHLQGMYFRLTDTAGIRMSNDIIELEGIKRTNQMIKKADLILLVLDVQKGIEKDLIEKLPKEKTILVWNKIDLPYKTLPELSFKNNVLISAKKKTGLQVLCQAMIDFINNQFPEKEEILITNARHKEAVSNAISACSQGIIGLQNQASPEFIILDIRQSLSELGKIIGIDVTEDILTSIFSKFCLGK